MQEVREEQARRKAEGKTAKYKSLKKEGAGNVAAQVMQTLLLRKTKRKLKTMKLAAQLGQTLLLRKI